ncbi:MAG: periplasmic heavy metal sensor [Pirellulales bacterium]
MYRQVALLTCLAVAVASPLALYNLQAAETDSVASEAVGRFVHTPLGKLITGRIGRAMVLRSELDMTTEQREQIRTILTSHRNEIKTSVKPVVQQRRKLRDAVTAQEPDEQQIRAAADALGKSIGDAAITMSKIAAELREVLTEDQLEKAKAFRGDNAAAVDRFLDKGAEL